MLYIHPKLRYIGELFIEVFLSPPRETRGTPQEKSPSSPRRKLPYISAHLRRTDFVYLNRAVPIKHAAEKLVDLMKEQNVSRVRVEQGSFFSIDPVHADRYAHTQILPRSLLTSRLLATHAGYENTYRACVASTQRSRWPPCQ